MKMIEERAKDYSDSHGNLFMDSAEEDGIYRSDLEDAFIAGAKSERKELLQWDDQSEANDIIDSKEFCSAWSAFVKYLFKWHDPKKELPEIDVELQVMPYADSNAYDVMRYDRYGWWQQAPGGGWCAATNAPARWRYIHTSMSYEAKARTE